MLHAVYDFLDHGRDLVIQWQRELTARPAVGPENKGVGEEEKAAWLTGELASMGVSDLRQHFCPDARVPSGRRPNISARVPGKSPITLWVIGHMDVVPPGEERLWDSPPFQLRVEGDYLYGRGVEDNHQAIVTAMLAAKSLISNEVVPDISLGLLFVADEETGMHHGLPHVLKSCDLIRPDDMFLVPDMGNRDGTMIEVAEKSCLWLRITVHGRQCHASTPDLGINSLVAASACILELETLYRLFRNKNPLFSPPWSTFVPSKKEANIENINTMPGRDVFYLDCRVLPEYDIAEVEKEVRAIAASVAARYRAAIDIDVVHREQAPAATPHDSAVIRRLKNVLKKQRGLDPAICGAGGQTVAACLRHRNLPAAVWATLIPNPHAPNERARVSSTIEDARVVVAMLFDDEGNY